MASSIYQRRMLAKLRAIDRDIVGLYSRDRGYTLLKNIGGRIYEQQYDMPLTCIVIVVREEARQWEAYERSEKRCEEWLKQNKDVQCP